MSHERAAFLRVKDLDRVPPSGCNDVLLSCHQTMVEKDEGVNIKIQAQPAIITHIVNERNDVRTLRLDKEGTINESRSDGWWKG